MFGNLSSLPLNDTRREHLPKKSKTQQLREFFIFRKEHQKVPLVNHRQKYFINGICGTFDITTNYFGPVIPEKLKKIEKLNQRVIKSKKVFP